MDHRAALPSGREPESLRVFILEDHELVRLGLQDLLESAGFVVIGMSGSAREATSRIPVLRPDLAVLDAWVPDGTGIEVCRDVRSVNPSLNCLMMTIFDDGHAARSVVLAGACGYVLKELDRGALLGAMQRAAHGQSLFSASVRATIIQSLIQPGAPDPRAALLTTRERQVLELIGADMTNRQIGERLSLSGETMRKLISSLLIKLGSKRRAERSVPLVPAPEP
ncbi:DNA-binding NarL/FixJ family response regulator [Paenarthrobacter nicotinovorans]|uniref:response regulator n=1 Tax=Micrococcaceae TaxID=1268 RepID=UPI000876B91B|nr:MULTISPECIES: response regulator transcription factor [Micrococcaceae]MDR6436693.1 DNA-binding NarL/FixJ family response regulator [Paenarthrobacter nicotinovorans]SCZ56889.1 DNA-binding response regulator, NarL/FixJ family, contains REC and HTH domains [Arthrobacter sp. UNCCL28]